MYWSPNETNLFECSILHYFIWRHDEANNPMTDAVVNEQNNDTNDSRNNYKRIIQVMKEELPHAVAMSEETPTSMSSRTPEVCFRWMKYATMRNILVNAKIPRNNSKKRKRDIADEDDKSTKVLKSAPKDVTITPDDAKEVLSTLRKEYLEAKQLAESLELKLSKADKLNCELLRFQQEKIRLENRLADLVSECEKTEQHKVDNDQLVIDNNEAKLTNLRTEFEQKKLRIELQESIYANAILYVVKDKEQQMEGKHLDFETRLQRLVEYKQEYGHCKVSKEFNPALYQWVKSKRQHFRDGNKSLTPERIAKLDAIGMVWEPFRFDKALISIPEEEMTLENAKEVLSKLREEHTEVKKTTEALESKIMKSEKMYSELLKFNDKKLRLEKRITNLESEEATTTTTTTTEQKLDDQHNNVNATEVICEIDQSNHVRAKLETKKRKLQLQETMYTNAILYEVHHDEKEQRKEAKNGAKLVDFESRIQELIQFKQEFGHCQVDRIDHSSLYHWLMRMRQNHRLKKPILSPERIAKLDALGVVWDIDKRHKLRTFDYYVEQCRDFKEKHGHLRILLLTERNDDEPELTNDDVCFRIWAQSMRIQYHKRLAIGSKATIDKHRITILDSIGFQWNIDATSTAEGGSNIDVDENLTAGEMMFRTRIEQLRKVKEIYGSCNEKKNILSVHPNNNSLIKWMKQQRIQMKFWLAGKSTRLSEERQEMLRSIEFDFNPRAHYTPPTSNKKTWPTKMETLALEIQEKKKKNNRYEDSEKNNAEHVDSDIE